MEPIFLKHGVNVVFAGHEHFYERIKPQKGIYYFISGLGGKLRKGDVKKGSPLTEKAYDRDMSFMLVEIHENQMHFQVISRPEKPWIEVLSRTSAKQMEWPRHYVYQLSP